ncbi:MAG: hypothetical protein IKB60_05620 [Clostridia bacterium]|nr:hypothetical protein [Clostridia bacterium]
MPVVCDTVYYSNNDEVRLYLNKNISRYVSLNPYSISSTGIKDENGNAVTLSGSVYFTPEADCGLYDISIANIWFKSGDATYYAQPQSGPCDVEVRIVNSSTETKTATLCISAVDTSGVSRLLKEEEVSLASNTEIIKGFSGLAFFSGERLDITLKK